MITSVAASLPLFGCNLQFFSQFGTFLCATIAFSWLFANFVFMGVMATVGPQDSAPKASATLGMAEADTEMQAENSALSIRVVSTSSDNDPDGVENQTTGQERHLALPGASLNLPATQELHASPAGPV